ncbi:MAG: DUF4136 domain-containing protein [Sphingomonadales bacterium]
MFKTTTKTVFAALGLLAAGCATQITSEVTRFHALSRPAGETVQIVHVDPKQNGSLEFDRFAQMIGDRFGKIGFRPAPPGEAPDIVARVGYSMTSGPASDPDKTGLHGSVGIGVGSHGSGVNVGLSGPLGSAEPTVRSYIRSLDLVMVRQSDSSILFEGHATSSGRTGNLTEIVPFLIDAMFDGFPGEHGKTVKVTAEIPPDGLRP